MNKRQRKKRDKLQNAADNNKVIENNFAGYTVVMRGGISQLTQDQESEVWLIALLANDYERLRKYIH